jgi:signal transduction histidine kinase/DNA-binding response OmpR family regulator
MSGALEARKPREKEKVNILLVDDQPAKLLGYEAILQDLNENLIKAHSGREALEYLLRGNVAVVLVDVCMPELDGFELADMIRQHPRCQKTAIIFVSGIHMSDLDRLKGYDFGAVDYVSVPVVPEILRARVSVFIDLYRKTHELEQFNRELELRVAERTQELSDSNAQLRVSEERLRLAVMGAGMGTWDTDWITGESHWSETFVKMMGYPPGHEVPASMEGFRDRIHPEDVSMVMKAIDRAKIERSIFSSEHRITRADSGAATWVSAFGRFFFDDGLPVRFVGVLFDINERKVLEESLRDADRRKDEFLAILAHELRNPLNPIRSAANVLRMQESSNTELAWSRDVIDRQVDHLTRLVDDLLDVSRITSGKLDLRRERVTLSEVVQSAVEASRPLIEDCGHTLEVSIPEEPVYLNADLVRLSQVIINLLNNAAKFTTRKDGHIRLTAENHTDGLTLSVADNGSGIQQDKLRYLFDMFYQVRDDMENSGSGLGIGLTLVRHLVEMHGGSIEAKSEGLNRGSEFMVHLPVSKALLDAVPKVPNPASGGPLRAETTRRILVVDDNRDSAESLAVLLQLSGHDVRAVYDGAQAMKAGATFRPEIVILDLGMPKMSGYEAARAIRGQEWGQGIYLIALTGWGQESDRKRTQAAGFNHHLTKPLNYDALKKILLQVPVKAPGVPPKQERSDAVGAGADVPA